MGALRLKLGKDLGLVAAGWTPLWVTDFPMFEWDDEENRFVALHHPFTAPAVDSIDDLRANAKTAVSRGYDMVLNGNEIGGGSIRIHSSAMQSAVFELLGIGAEEAEGQVRLPARRAEVRRAAARWHRVRHRSHRRAHGGHRIDPRRHRLPEDHHRAVPDDRRAFAGAGCAAGRSARVRAREAGQVMATVADTVVIRRATLDDAQAWSTLADRAFVEAFGHLYPPDDLAQFLHESYSVDVHRKYLAGREVRRVAGRA
jgi:hypothetical protein